MGLTALFRILATCTGWQVTVDQYFEKEVYFTIDTVVQNLAADHNRRFIYVETAFFARWWEQASDEKRALATTLVKRKQLEFTNGGWCMLAPRPSPCLHPSVRVRTTSRLDPLAPSCAGACTMRPRRCGAHAAHVHASGRSSVRLVHTWPHRGL